MATRNTGRENVTTPALKRFKLQPNRNYVGFALLQTTRDFLKALAILATCFRVDAPSFSAGAAVSSGFFVADGLAVTIFFFLQGTRENVRWCAAFGKKACSQQLGPSVPKQYDR